MTKEDLKEGYVEFNPILKDHAKTAFQKRMVDEKGKTKFFLNIYVYPKFNREQEEPFSVEAQFNRGKDVFNLEYLINHGTTVEDIEQMFIRFWEVNDFDYYEK